MHKYLRLLLTGRQKNGAVNSGSSGRHTAAAGAGALFNKVFYGQKDPVSFNNLVKVPVPEIRNRVPSAWTSRKKYANERGTGFNSVPLEGI